jgi:hypothetical protein
MATLAYPANLQSAQTGNADSTNTILRRADDERNLRAHILRIVSTVGATPTVTVNIMGSFNGTDFFNVPYSALGAVAGEWSKAALVITTAVTGLYYLKPGEGWRYLKLVMSANTNVTLTSDLL